MDAIQHQVISLVKGLSARFPSLSFTYGYDVAAGQHLVDVDPTDMYKSDEYMLAEADVYDAWDAAFPDEDLVFVSNNPYHRIKYPFFAIVGKVVLDDVKSMAFSNVPMLVDGDGAPCPTVPAGELFDSLDLAERFVIFGRESVVHTPPVSMSEYGDLAAGEYNYAMAA